MASRPKAKLSRGASSAAAAHAGKVGDPAADIAGYRWGLWAATGLVAIAAAIALRAPRRSL